jgi:hypothetical protein
VVPQYHWHGFFFFFFFFFVVALQNMNISSVSSVFVSSVLVTLDVNVQMITARETSVTLFAHKWFLSF